MTRALQVTLILVVLLSLLACAPLCEEYEVDRQWQRCEFVEQRACGDTIRCGDVVITCTSNLKKRGC